MKQIISLLLIASLCVSQISAQDTTTIVPIVSDYDRPNPVVAYGTASSKLLPELAVISFSVETLEMKASHALGNNTASYNSVIDAVTSDENGIEESSIATTGFQFYPQYSYKYDTVTQQTTSVFEGYKVINSFTITLDDITMVGSIIDMAIENGATRIDSVSYTINKEHETSIKKTLIKDAVADAKEQATELLAAVDYQIRGIKDIQLLQDSNYPIPSFDSAAASDGSSAKFFPSEYEVTVRVMVSYLIEAKPADDGETEPLPDDGEDTPLPDDGEDGEETPLPDDGEDIPLPDDGEDIPLPDDGEDNVDDGEGTVDDGETDPIPDDGEDLPFPDDGEDGESAPLPDDGETAPLPDDGETAPLPDDGEVIDGVTNADADTGSR